MICQVLGEVATRQRSI